MESKREMIQKLIDEFRSSTNKIDFKHYILVDGEKNNLTSYKGKNGKIKIENIKGSFSEYIKRKIERFCVEQDKPYLINNCKLNNIIESLHKYNSFKLFFGYIDKKIGFREKELNFYSIDIDKKIFLIILKDVTDSFSFCENKAICKKEIYKCNVDNKKSFLNLIKKQEDVTFTSEELINRIEECVKAKSTYAGVKTIILNKNLSGKFIGKVDIVIHILSSIVFNFMKNTKPDGKIFIEISEKKKNSNNICVKFVLYSDNNIRDKMEISEVFSLDKTENSNINIEKTVEGQNILVVEHQEINWVVLKNVFESVKMNPFFAIDGNDAIIKLKESNENFYSAIFIDIRMPVMDGMQAIKIIKKMNRYFSKIPIIGMSPYNSPEGKERIVDSGFTDLISKPITTESLLEVIKNYYRKIT